MSWKSRRQSGYRTVGRVACTAALALVAACGSAGTAVTTPTNLQVGFPADLTGPNATYDVSVQQGVTVAVNRLKQLGGVTVSLTTLDTQSSAAQAVVNFSILINQNKVVAIDGAFSSGSGAAAGPVAQAAGVPLIFGSENNPGLENIGDVVIRTQPAEVFILPLLAQYAATCLHAQKVAAFYDRSAVQPVNSTKVTLDAMKALGMTVVTEQTVLESQLDISPQATLVVASKPDVVVINALGTYELQIIHALRTAGLPAAIPIISGQDMNTAVITSAGSSLPSAISVTTYDTSLSNAANKVFLPAFRKAYGHDPDYLAAQGYDGINFLAQAASQAGIASGDPITVQRSKLLKALRAIRTFDGVLGTLHFVVPQPNVGVPQPSVPGVLLKIQSGNIQSVTATKC
jgi:branched-chain amino acid transport system substrate-binding protein